MRCRDCGQLRERVRRSLVRRIFVKLLAAACVGTSLVVSTTPASGQDGGHEMKMNMPSGSQSMPGMAGMSHDQSNMQSHSLVESLLQHATSGTDAEPNSTPVSMLMATKANWTLMFHGEAFLVDVQQAGPRGFDKLFSTNWWMPMAQRKFGNGTLTIRAMLSFEPATISSRRYPELFQQGETAFGRAIVDGQHPHDFFMELAALYDYKLADRTLLSFYAAPMGDPAMGPVAYPHRASASEDPIAPLGHHFQDSTQIAATWLHSESRIATCGWKLPAFTDASPTNSTGTSTPEKSTPGPPASTSIPARTGPCSIRLRSFTARRRSPPPQTSVA